MRVYDDGRLRPMSDDEPMTLVLYTGNPDGQTGWKAVLTVTAAQIILCSQYADLRDANDKLIATVTWTSPINARRL